MKEMILVCDRCKISNPAVATLRLFNGTKKGTDLDVCKKHQAEIYKSFVPVRASKAFKGGPMTEEQKVDLKGSIYNYVNHEGKATSPKIHENLSSQISMCQLRKLLSEMVKEKKIARKGVGPGSSYHKR